MPVPPAAVGLATEGIVLTPPPGSCTTNPLCAALATILPPSLTTGPPTVAVWSLATKAVRLVGVSPEPEGAGEMVTMATGGTGAGDKLEPGATDVEIVL